MSKKDPFQSPKRRLARGKSHIRKLETRIAKFFKTVPHEKIVEKDAHGFELHKLHVTKPVPEICTHYAAEALEALRSALDQTGFSVATLGGKLRAKSAKFPFGDTPLDVDNDIRRGSKDLPPEIQTLFRGFKPYKGGNMPLWTLNKLRNSTHTALVPVGGAVGGMHVKHFTGTGPLQIPIPRWDREKNEIMFARVGPGGNADYNLNISLFVAFDQVDFTNEAIPTNYLWDMAAKVDSVIRATQAECRRIGLIP